MTRQYLIGELSVRLEQLQATTGQGRAGSGPLARPGGDRTGDRAGLGDRAGNGPGR
jgi:hypothetical protein